MEEVKVFYILDPNDFENFDEESQTLQEYVEATGVSKEGFREEVIKLLKYYYEARSDYGDPVASIVRFVPDEKLKDLIQDYNYVVLEDLKEAIEYVKKEINQ